MSKAAAADNEATEAMTEAIPGRKKRKKSTAEEILADKLFRPEGSIKQTLQQDKILELYEAKKALAESEARVAALEERAADLVKRGAKIQKGTFKARKRAWQQRHPSYKQALIDATSKEYQLKVLEDTKPKTHYRVWFE